MKKATDHNGERSRHWQVFSQTGRIEDYLRYRAATQHDKP